MHTGQDDLLAAEINGGGVVVAQAFLPALAIAARFAPAFSFVFFGAAGGGLAPLGDCFSLEDRALGDVDQGIDGAGIVDLVVGQGRGISHARPGVGEHLIFEAALGHAGAEQFGHAGVLVADQSLDVFPLRVRRVGGRIERVEGDVAGAARCPDQEGRLDRGVGQLAHALVGFDAGGGGLGRGETGPRGEVAVQLLPPGGVKARVGELADAEGAGRGAELQITGGMTLIRLAALTVWIIGVKGGILEAAGRVDITRLADVLEQHVVAGAPVETVGLLGRLRRAFGIAGLAACRVVDDAPGPEAVVALVGAQDAVPVDEDANALLEGVGVEPFVAAGRLEPDQPADAFRFVQPLAGTGLMVRGVLIDCGGLRNLLAGRCGRCRDSGVLSMDRAERAGVALIRPDTGGDGDSRKSGQWSTFHAPSPVGQTHSTPHFILGQLKPTLCVQADEISLSGELRCSYSKSAPRCRRVAGLSGRHAPRVIPWSGLSCSVTLALESSLPG